jgi:protocatechuate 3,4-dioxygenase beta subunit
MKQLLLIAVLTFTTLQTPQVNTGVIEGRVTRVGSSEGISDVQVSLIGPSTITSSGLGGLYTPNTSLTPDMRAQIDQLINSAPPGISLEVVANAAIRMEANLLGLPAPALPPPNTTTAAPPPPPQTAVVTNSEGVFAFRNLAPGRYQIRAQREGYFGAPPPGSAGVGAPTLVNMTATVVTGQPTQPVSISMLRGAIVSGRVRDPNGQPLQTAQVGAFQINYQNGRKVLQQVNSRQTDDRGEYRLYWLPPGDYLIGTMPRRSGITAAPTSQDNYARTFFPNTVEGQSATVVHAGEGAEISGVDVLIRPDATGRILGRVVHSFVGPNGQPAIASTFYLFPANPVGLADTGITTFPNSSPNRTTGEFDIRGLLPGPYELMSNVPDGNGRQAWGRTRVNVTPGDVRDVTLSITPGIELKAHLSVDGAAPGYTMQAPPAGARGAFTVLNGVPIQPPPAPTAPVPTPTNRIQLRSAEGLGVVTPYENASNQDMSYDPSGVFTFRSVVPGKYFVAVQPLPANAYVVDVKAGGTSVFDSGIDISSQTGEIQVFVSTSGAKIQGRVIDAAQKPAASARVVLVPPASRRQNVQLYKVATSDSSGNFTISGIAPGDYKLFTWETVPNTAWLNQEFLAPYEGKGLAVTVSSSGSTPATIELKLIPKDPDKR